MEIPCARLAVYPDGTAIFPGHGKYLGGRPFTQYVISFIISSVFLFA